MKKSKIYVVKPSLPSYLSYINIIRKIWKNNILTNQGPLHNEFNQKINDFLNIKYSTLFCNGHLALECAIKALDLKQGGEIITTPFTFISTTNAIVNCGFKPVFCDIKESDYTIDETKIESLITEKTVAILAVHVYGNPCNVKEIDKIARKYSLKVIYDAAHAFNLKISGKSILTYGDISMVSFHATKLFNTIEGGMLAYSNKEYIKKLDIMKNFGLYNDECLIKGSINAKMNEFSSAMGLANLKNVEKNIKKRKKIVELYKKLIKKEGIIFCKEQDNIQYNYSYLPILIDENKYGLNRDQLYNLLIKNNIYCRKYFYPLTCDMNCYVDLKNKNELTNAKYISDRVLTLPLYPTLRKKSIVKISDIINRKE